MKHSTSPPTKAEAQRIERMLGMGCICCAASGRYELAECHHIVEGNRRLGHWFTLPICPGHHRGAWRPHQRQYYAELGLSLPPSISSGSKRFERHYGSEKELFMRVQARLGLPFTWPTSKILPRRSVA